MNKSVVLKTTVVTFEQYTALDFNPPATFFIMNALGEYIFIHTRERLKAQTWVDEHYGKGQYTVKASKLQRGKGDVTCRGSQTKRGQKK